MKLLFLPCPNPTHLRNVGMIPGWGPGKDWDSEWEKWYMYGKINRSNYVK